MFLTLCYVFNVNDFLLTQSKLLNTICLQKMYDTKYYDDKNHKQTFQSNSGKNISSIFFKVITKRKLSIVFLN